MEKLTISKKTKATAVTWDMSPHGLILLPGTQGEILTVSRLAKSVALNSDHMHSVDLLC